MTTSIISRRAFLKLSSKYPNLLKQKSKAYNSQNIKKDESAWPKSLQMVGYAAVVLSIPYSMSVFVAESARVRSTLEEKGGDLGQSIVKWVRWYWGHPEDVPYFESTMKITADSIGGGEDRLQLRGEESPTVRSTQDVIKCTADSDLTFRLTSDGGLESTECMRGDTTLSDSKLFGEDVSKRLFVSFDEDEEQEEKLVVEKDAFSQFKQNEPEGRSDSRGELKRLTTIWSSWNHFPSDFMVPITSSVSGGGTIDSTEMKIDELVYNISELQKLLRDSSCTRDRDDMEGELQEIQSELRGLKRAKRFGKLRNILS